MKCSVIVDGNRHQLDKTLATIVPNGIITLEKCKSVYENLHNEYPNIEIDEIEIDLFPIEEIFGDWDELSEEEYQSRCERFHKRKTAYYQPKRNLLRIYQYGLPIYENYNGTICNDEEALADCLM